LPQPNPGELIPVGKIVGVHGIKGGMKVEPWTDFPERFDVGARLFLGGVERKVIANHWHKGQARITLEGFERPEDVQPWIGQLLLVDAKDAPELEEDEFEVRHLLGLEVVTTTGEVLGKLEKVLPSPAQDVLVVGEIMIPMAEQFVKEVDLEQGRIVVELIPGMRGEEEDDVSG